MVLYHATDMNNLGSIMRSGIRPSKYDGKVYLADSAENAIKFVMMRGYSEILVLPVEVSGKVEETFDHSYEFFGCKAYGYEGTIGFDRVILNKVLKFQNPLAYDLEEIIGKAGRNSQV